MVMMCIGVCWMLQKLLIVYIMENYSEYYCLKILSILIIRWILDSYLRQFCVCNVGFV